MPAIYDAFFRTATGGQTPYAYQRRLACGEPSRTAGDTEGTTCASQLITIPTGLGKTAAVVLAWLWNRVAHPDAAHRDTWPRRLVYCLPMRTLVEQTRDEIQNWLRNLRDAALAGDLPLSESALRDLLWLAGTDDLSESQISNLPSQIRRKAASPIILMGGEENDRDRREWDIHPERPAILIGTQDMLLSRALNRGYGMARARWPMHFGLLNNDALWILDETQLMGVGVRTSAQLEGLRQKLGLAASSFTWWASATLDTRLLETPDHPSTPPLLALDADDLTSPAVLDRVRSIKHLTPLPLALVADTTKAKSPYIDALALLVLEYHQPDTLTIVILNRVDRVRDLYAALDKLAKKQTLPPRLLVHSRFRPMEREATSIAVKTPGEKILIATQAIEAGVDISARTLITELAPWSSLVQRFGRCNRKGEFNATGGANIHWIDLAPENDAAASGLALPYTPGQLASARELLVQTTTAGEGASPAALEKRDANEPLAESHLLRRKDLIDLFDTTPDLAGLDIDVGRYIRDGDERDVQVFWRELPEKPTPSELDAIDPQRAELVRVATHEFKKFAEKNKGSLWHWDALEGNWHEFRETYRIAPGQVFLVAQACGGYSATLGWTGDKAKEPIPVLSLGDQTTHANPRDGQGRDDESQTRFQTLAEHTAHVVHACNDILDALPASTTATWRAPLLTAAHWHDVGKAHDCFQNFLITGREDDPDYQPHKSQLLAKSPWRAGTRFKRAHFRHELASALAWLQAGPATDPETRNLVAYLIATHHGKIRLSLRAMPGENLPHDAEGRPQPDRLHARGVWQGDSLPGDTSKSLDLGNDVPPTIPELDLSVMRMGETNGSPSWTARMLALRDAPDLGVFRLAWLETLLRSADAVGSKIETSTLSHHAPPHDLATNRDSLAQPSPAGEATPPLGNHPDPGGAEHGLRERTGRRDNPPRQTRPAHATRYLETTRGTLSYTELAPLLAEQVQNIEAELSAGAFDSRPLDETLLLDLQARIVGDLIPDWAGRWRNVEVSVGRLTPPAPHLVPQRLRDYCLDLQARWPDAAATLGDLTLEFLAYAEGRFLTIHPFPDFNGRTIRVFLNELLRRLDLPPVRLEAEGETERAAYFAALEAADIGDYHPLVLIWQQRLNEPAPEA